MTVPVKLNIPTITFNRGLFSGIFIPPIGGPVNLIRPIIRNEGNHTDSKKSDKGKDY